MVAIWDALDVCAAPGKGTRHNIVGKDAVRVQGAGRKRCMGYVLNRPLIGEPGVTVGKGAGRKHGLWGWCIGTIGRVQGPMATTQLPLLNGVHSLASRSAKKRDARCFQILYGDTLVVDGSGNGTQPTMVSC